MRTFITKTFTLALVLSLTLLPGKSAYANTRVYSRLITTYVDSYTKDFKLKDFDQLQITGAFTVNITKGESFRVRITGEREEVEQIEAEVRNSELVINYKDSKMRLGIKQKPRIEIEMPALRAVRFSGMTKAIVNPGFTPTNFVAYIAGAADAEITIQAPEMYFDLSGTSSLKAKGKTEKLKVNTTGTATLDAFEMPSTEAQVDASGTSGAKLNVSDAIKATASGASSIRYKGNAKLSTVSTSRMSSIKKVE